MFAIRNTLFASLIACGSIASHAGQEKGNGGDAVVMQDGRLVLFDFFERGIDADAHIERLHGSVNPGPQGMRGFVDMMLINGPDFAGYGDNAKKVKDAIALVLNSVSARFPALVMAIDDEADKLRWTKAAATIVPNPDTQPFIDPNQFHRIGCARNIAHQIVYSPECGSERMSPAQQAGLILHEIIYSLYRQARPDSDNSFNVRTIVAQLFDDPDFHYMELEEVLKDTGLGAIIDTNEAINRTFYRSENWSRSTYLDCDFAPNKRRLQNLRLDFIGAMEVIGELRSTNKRKLVIEPVDGQEALPRDGTRDEPEATVWQASLPRTNLSTREMKLWLTSSSDNETLKTAIRFSNDSTHEIEITYVTFVNHDEEVSYTIKGTCRQYRSKPRSHYSILN